MRATVLLGSVCAVAALAIGVVVLACSSSDDAAPGGVNASGSSSGSSGGASSSGSSGASSSGTSGGGSSGSSGSSGTSSSGAPDSGAPDNGLIGANSIWRTTTEWYRAVDTAPLAQHSGEMITALKTWGEKDVFQIDFSFNVLEGNGGALASFPQDDEADNVQVPIPANGYIEGDNAYTACPDGEDCHMIIFDRPANRLYEVYQAHKTGNTWDGFVAMWKLDKTYPRTNRGQGCTSADAAGLPITPGLIGYKEAKAGTINHALRFIMMNDYIHGALNDKNTPNVVYPGSHGSTKGASATGIPYGGRLRLKSSILDTDPRIKTPGAKALVQALKKYGMILADGGNLPLVAESARVYHDTDPTATWDGLLGPKDLSFLRPADFEVIAIPKDNPSNPAAGWYETKVDYNGQLTKPLGCNVIVQPQ